MSGAHDEIVLSERDREILEFVSRAGGATDEEIKERFGLDDSALIDAHGRLSEYVEVHAPRSIWEAALLESIGSTAESYMVAHYAENHGEGVGACAVEAARVVAYVMYRMGLRVDDLTGDSFAREFAAQFDKFEREDVSGD